MSNSEETVLLKIDGRIAYLELNRPEALNAINEVMIKELLAKLKEVKETETDVLILSGRGKGFSAGGDIKTMLNEMEKPVFYKIMDQINDLVITLYTMPKLVISAVNGAAAGLGFSLALATDYIIAEQSAVFAMNFIKIGLIPDGGTHYFLNKRMGEVNAKQLIWEGKNKTAQEVIELGLVNEVVNEDAMKVAQAKANEMLNLPVKSMLKTKQIYTEMGKEELKKFLEMEKIGQYEMRITKDHKEGIQAFVEKRLPKFIGK